MRGVRAAVLGRRKVGPRLETVDAWSDRTLRDLQRGHAAVEVRCFAVAVALLCRGGRRSDLAVPRLACRGCAC